MNTCQVAFQMAQLVKSSGTYMTSMFLFFKMNTPNMPLQGIPSGEIFPTKVAAIQSNEALQGKNTGIYDDVIIRKCFSPWWHHPMDIFSALMALCAGNSPVTGEFPSQRPVTWSFDVFLDLYLYKRLSKQSWGWWFEMPLHSLWCHCNDITGPLWGHSII